MKKKKPILIVLFLTILTLFGCKHFPIVSKNSVLLKYYETPLKWAGIKFGETTREEAQTLITQISEIAVDDQEQISDGIHYVSPTPNCYDLKKGFRESGFCVKYINGIAQAINFESSNLTLSEIENFLGNIEEFAVVQRFDHRSSISYFGLSTSNGFFIFGGNDSFLSSLLGIDEDLEELRIGPNEEFSVYLGSEEGIELLGKTLTGELTWRYLTEEGGFQAWIGYGKYEVQKPETLN